MLTVKTVERGIETIYSEVERTSIRRGSWGPDDVPGISIFFKNKDVYEVDGNSMKGDSLRDGEDPNQLTCIYVMNELGKTVATYRIETTGLGDHRMVTTV